MTSEYVVEHSEKCPECNGKILITEDYSEAQCEDCLEEWTLKDEDEITETDLKEGYVDITEEEKAAEYDFDEDEEVGEAMDSDDDEVIEGEFNENKSPANILATSHTLLDNINVDDLAAQVLAKALAMAIDVIATPRKSVPAEPTNPFKDGTRESQLMETLLTGPQNLDDIKKSLPKTRGKPPTAKTIKSWVMALDNLKDWKVIEEDDMFSVERRRDE